MESHRLESAGHESAGPGFFRVEGDGLLQFWESEATRPVIASASAGTHVELKRHFEQRLPSCLHAPFQPGEEIRSAQLTRVRALVERACEIPVYAEKYAAVGFEPGDLQTWEDFERLPVVTKDELIAATPARCVSPRFSMEDLFSTRTFGTSGKTLIIKVDLGAILTDTLQGARQFWLQSGFRYRPDHVAAMIYTVPWWFEAIESDFRTVFISGLIAPGAVGRILGEVGHHVVSCYPTNLEALIPFLDSRAEDGRYLAVVHSETSSPHERRAWSRALGVPVLDEYSSEEATRIALELPCGHYHVCDDTVHLEVVDPVTGRHTEDGEAGLAVVTNLLNEAMPFIRYVQGDYVTRPRSPSPCLVGWSQLASVDGRRNDSFVNQAGREVPAGTILDLVYRWMFDAGVYVKEFELVQRAPDEIVASIVTPGSDPEARLRASIGHLEELLGVCLGHPVRVSAELVDGIQVRPGKRRLIRRELAQ
jgi:phenylacetate-CoA ligase